MVEKIAVVAIFYRGAGVGTYWHANDARLSGFLPRNAGMSNTPDRVIQHVHNGRTDSPYVSLSLSYGVALNYALEMGTRQPTVHDPAYVYEVEITAAHGATLINPVKLLASGAPNPLDPVPYQHNGHPNILIGAIFPMLAFILRLPIPVPPGSSATVTPTLRTGPHWWGMIAALRDAEVLAYGAVPIPCITNRYSVY